MGIGVVPVRRQENEWNEGHGEYKTSFGHEGKEVRLMRRAIESLGIKISLFDKIAVFPSLRSSGLKEKTRREELGKLFAKR